MAATATVALKTTAILSEGPHWDPKENKLLWVDILGKEVHRFDPETAEV